ncbi:MAG: molybdenum cofactor biosynthesis protein MoaE [Phycisphaerales bacterium]
MSVRVRIHQGPLAPATTMRQDGAGAVVIFEGIVRPTEEGEPIRALEYDVYHAMAERSLRELCETTLERFGLLAIEVEHSAGVVPAHECSFRLSVASAHRAEALKAMDWFIYRMKESVPIWKRAAHGTSTETPP